MMRGGGGGGGRFDPFKGITLTADQKTKLDDIRGKYRKQMDSLRTSGSNDRTAFRGLMEAQMKESRDVLTTEQQKVYDDNVKELQERMKQRMQHGQGGGDAPPPPPPQQ